MVLISIHPFAFRKIFLIAATLLGLSAFCFADSLFMARRFGPPVERTSLEQAIPRLPENGTGGKANDWSDMGNGQRIPIPVELPHPPEQPLDATTLTSLLGQPLCVYHLGALPLRAIGPVRASEFASP
jgi:hypothetical protein